MRTPNGRCLGAIRSPHDTRDHVLAAKATMPTVFPDKVDFHLAANAPYIRDQSTLGCCTGFSAYRMLGWMYPTFVASPLWAYYMGRRSEGTQLQDAGCQTRDMLKVMAKGLPSEDAWAYDVAKYAEAPPASAVPIFKVGSYSRLWTRQDVLGWLSQGNPVMFSIDLPMRFDGPEAEEHGVVPRAMEGNAIGWHCIVAEGYDLHFRDSAILKDSSVSPDDVEDETLIFANHWSTVWGAQGYGFLPLSYALDPKRGNDAWSVHPIPQGDMNV